MTPAAHIQASIEVVQDWMDGTDGLDKVLARWSRNHRFAGSKDRAAIADHVYGAVRRLRSAGWVAAADTPTARDILRGHLLLDQQDPMSIFTGQGYAPPALEPDEQNRRALAEAPPPVRLDYPDWLSADMQDLSEGIPDALRYRAEVDLRVNTLKADVPKAIAKLAEDGIIAAPQSLASTALRISTGARKLTNSQAFRDGLVEVQDAASQAVVALAAAQPGETVLDLCAGGGGKALAMAAMMHNQGKLFAFDISAKRLAQLPPRAERAGATVTLLTKDRLPSLKKNCDLVLVDAPCSGSGAWRRNPDAKWRLTPAGLDRLTETQASLLDQATQFTTKSGRIGYVTCSLFKRENAKITSAFLDRHPDFALIEERQFTPLDGADGLYAGILQRR